MRFLIICFLLIGSQCFSAPILEEIRSKFPFIENKEQAESYIKQLENTKDLSSQAYLAAMYFFKSKYVKFPTTKFKYFKKGKELLENLILNNPLNAELRYIRYIFQHQIPKFLGYYSAKSNDFEVIINSNFLKKKHLNNLLELRQISEEHKQKLLQL
ncbi:hypothetical protein SAMN05444411_10449 [Lutibacter oricola]|uniref:Uncharacterized protein n=1 Tax=Lutibacter oricola TaxID=762486 RepID=A0A1H3A7D3_9FLAO|nr:hypothetical protein [Lutibacter oricola]SDX25662.1 hypothetical protein SAMN05444411_10449 [Lutibacter oricola]